jgi:hypothetical protein
MMPGTLREYQEGCFPAKNVHLLLTGVTPLAAEILDSIPQLDERDQVFGARSTNGFNSMNGRTKSR